MPSSARSIRSRKAWLPTGADPVPGVEGAEGAAAVWEEDNGRTDAPVSVTGLPGWTEERGSLAALEDAAFVWM